VDVMQKKEIHLDHSGIHLVWSLLHPNSMDPYIMMYITMICPPSGMRNILRTNGLVCIAYYHLTLCTSACFLTYLAIPKPLSPFARLCYCCCLESITVNFKQCTDRCSFTNINTVELGYTS
jgi:hypothetical protein